MKHLSVAVLFFCLLCVGCNGRNMDLSKFNPGSEKPAPSPEEPLTYTNDIYSLFEQKCGVCHGQGSPHGNWLVYENAFLKREAIYEQVVELKKMPMGFPMSQDERDLVAIWIEQGAAYE